MELYKFVNDIVQDDLWNCINLSCKRMTRHPRSFPTHYTRPRNQVALQRPKKEERGTVQKARVGHAEVVEC